MMLDDMEDEHNFQSYPELTASEKTTHINYSPIHLESHKYLAPIHTHVNHANGMLNFIFIFTIISNIIYNINENKNFKIL